MKSYNMMIRTHDYLLLKDGDVAIVFKYREDGDNALFINDAQYWKDDEGFVILNRCGEIFNMLEHQFPYGEVPEDCSFTDGWVSSDDVNEWYEQVKETLEEIKKKYGEMPKVN